MNKITKKQFDEVQSMSHVSNSLIHVLGDINSFISLLQRVNDVHSLRVLLTDLGELYSNSIENFTSSLSDETEC